MVGLYTITQKIMCKLCRLRQEVTIAQKRCKRQEGRGRKSEKRREKKRERERENGREERERENGREERERENGREERERENGREEREREDETEETRSRTRALRDDTPKRHPELVSGSLF